MNQLTIIENPANLCTIAKEASECLQASPYLDLREISCECRDRVLILKGHVFSFHDKQIAQETVAGVKGMSGLVNEIEVD